MAGKLVDARPSPGMTTERWKLPVQSVHRRRL